jgi:hypothetical protein
VINVAIPLPAGPSPYVMPGSHNLDPPYSWQSSGTWPNPRTPQAFESESRAPGTGLIASGGRLPTREAIADIPQPKQAPSVITEIERPRWLPISTAQVVAQFVFRGE